MSTLKKPKITFDENPKQCKKPNLKEKRSMKNIYMNSWIETDGFPACEKSMFLKYTDDGEFCCVEIPPTPQEKLNFVNNTLESFIRNVKLRSFQKFLDVRNYLLKYYKNKKLVDDIRLPEGYESLEKWFDDMKNKSDEAKQKQKKRNKYNVDLELDYQSLKSSGVLKRIISKYDLPIDLTEKDWYAFLRCFPDDISKISGYYTASKEVYECIDETKELLRTTESNRKNSTH